MSLNIGFLSTSRIGKKTAQAILRTPNANLIAVGSRDITKAQAFIDELALKGVTAYGSYEEIIQNPDVHAIYIPLPTSMHVEWAIKAAKAGKHILLEKPITVTEEECKQILDNCERVVFMDGTMFVHNARCHQICRTIREAKMGPVRYMQSEFSFRGGEDFMGNNIRANKDLDTLGCLGDLGWYCIRWALLAFRSLPVKVRGKPFTTFSSDGAIIQCGCILQFPCGGLCDFSSSFLLPMRKNVEIVFENGGIIQDDFTAPRKETEAGYLLYDGPRKEREESVVVNTPNPQEVEMWTTFSNLCLNQSANQEKIEEWKYISYVTQKVTSLCYESITNDNREVTVQMEDYSLRFNPCPL